MNDYTREQLVSLCERGVVPVGKWHNRDSADAQRQLGEACALLKAGAEYLVLHGGSLGTDDSTIWIMLFWPGFDAFEYDRSNEKLWDDDHFYLPTESRLERANGDDWY